MLGLVFVAAWVVPLISSFSPPSSFIRRVDKIPAPRSAGKKDFEMEYTTLGSSDLRVSKVCLGTMTWGQQNSRAEGMAQLDVAFDDYGVNFLDTAEMYPVPTKAETQGETDRTVAAWLRSRGASRRDEVVLATKVAGASERITWLRRSGEGTRLRYADVVESVDASLRRLGTDYVDLLQLHWPDRYVPLFGADGYDLSQVREAVPFEEQLRAIADLQAKGKVRHFGLSNETPYGVCAFGERARATAAAAGGAGGGSGGGPLPRAISLQNSYSLLVRSEYESGGLAEACAPHHENLGLLAYSPLAGGILSGKYRGGGGAAGGSASTPGSRLNLFPGFMDRYKKSVAVEAVEKYAAVAEKHGLSCAELSLAWCYSRPWVASTIIGATSEAQLRENLEAWRLAGTFTDEMNDDVNEVYKRFRDPAKL